MKRIIAVAMLAAANLLAGHHASAQEQQLTATIPFAFTLSDKVLPPGTYVISKLGENALSLQCKNTRAAALTATHIGSTWSGRPMLVFERYGDKYFLHEVHASSSTMNVSVARSKAEKRILIQEAVVRNGGETQVALIK
jgi:hypothetical protein